MDSQEDIKVRIEKAEVEMESAPEFDLTIVNDDLDLAKREIEGIVSKFISDE